MMTFTDLVEYIKDYDSDTFFAKGFDVTHAEAEKLACKFIDHFVNHGLDGVKLDVWLYDLRGDD